jgi:pyruvate/2-oxoglutarate dehydrogenase complex dihydrolipoamide acyltransferase (E2) component
MGEKRVKLSRMRKLIGENLKKSILEIPQASGYARIDVTELLQLQQKLGEQGIKASITALLVHAIALGLKKYPQLNARQEGDEVVYYDSVNPGIGTDTKNGLMVLVMKDVQDMTLLETCQAFRDLMGKLKENKLTMDEISGGTITISNLSKSRTLYFSSIINNNESLIMGVGGIHKEASVMPDGSILPRDICYVCININHTLVDGMTSALFLEYLCEILEQPAQHFRLDGIPGMGA